MKCSSYHGSALSDLRTFHMQHAVKQATKLDKVQSGLMPSDWKPMPSNGIGVAGKSDTGRRQARFG